MACGKLATLALLGICALVLSGCAVAGGAASLAVGTVKLGGKLAVGTAGAAGRMVFHKRDGHCFTRDSDGHESPISCP